MLSMCEMDPIYDKRPNRMHGGRVSPRRHTEHNPQSSQGVESERPAGHKGRTDELNASSLPGGWCG